MPVRLSAKADNDIEGILEYTLTRFGPEQANSYYLSLKGCLDFLATNPAAGRERQELNFSVRSHLHREHNIFYRVQEDHILIVRVLHQSMDVVRHLGRKL